MPNNANATTTGADITSTVAAAGSTVGSKFKEHTQGKWGIIIFSLVSLGLFIGSFVSMSQFLGSKDDWNLIQPQVTKVLILTLIGTMGLIIASILYYVQDPARTMYFVLVVCCLSLGLSYSALAIAAISR
jgi:hypothetical protein